MTSWELLTQALDEHPKDEHTVAWHGIDGIDRHASFRLDRRRRLDEYQAESTYYLFGADGARAIAPVPTLPRERNVLGAAAAGLARAASVTGTLVRVLGLTLIGRLPSTSIGGPILVYEVAGVAAQHGFDHFLAVAALISLNLGLLNLLPVPLLDGGQASIVLSRGGAPPAGVAAGARAGHLHRPSAPRRVDAARLAQRPGAPLVGAVEMIVLAVDTSTLHAGAALWRAGRVLAERRRVVTTHSEALLPMIDEIFVEAALAPADLAAIACGAGPGSFTGLRIGLATCKGLCFALPKPLVMVSSLAALAARAPDGRVLATIDAFKGEVYAAVYEVRAGVPTLDGAERVLPPAQLVPALDAIDAVVGSGAQKYRELAARLLDEEPGPRPADVARLAALRAARGDYDDSLAPLPPMCARPRRSWSSSSARSRLDGYGGGSSDDEDRPRRSYRSTPHRTCPTGNAPRRARATPLAQPRRAARAGRAQEGQAAAQGHHAAPSARQLR